MTKEQTLVLIKPDGVARKLVGTVLNRIEQKGLTLERLDMTTISKAQAEEHYQEHAGAPFFDDITTFLSSGPLVAAIVSGPNAISAVRQLAGATNPVLSAPGSIRGEFATEMSRNVIHASDSPESALREAAIYFPDH